VAFIDANLEELGVAPICAAREAAPRPSRWRDARVTTTASLACDALGHRVAVQFRALHRASRGVCVDGPDANGWDDVAHLELAELSWVRRFSTERLHGYCQDVPPAEFEAAFFADREADRSPVGIQWPQAPSDPGWFSRRLPGHSWRATGPPGSRHRAPPLGETGSPMARSCRCGSRDPPSRVPWRSRRPAHALHSGDGRRSASHGSSRHPRPPGVSRVPGLRSVRSD